MAASLPGTECSDHVSSHPRYLSIHSGSFLDLIFFVISKLSSVQRNAQVATLEPILQSEKHRAGHPEDEGPAGVFRKVSCSVAKAVVELKL